MGLVGLPSNGPGLPNSAARVRLHYLRYKKIQIKYSGIPGQIRQELFLRPKKPWPA